jgi:hypothetical protein
MLENLDDLIEFLQLGHRIVSSRRTLPGGQIHCSSCGDYRRVYISALYAPAGIANIEGWELDHAKIQLSPSLLTYECVQCSAKFTALIYEGPSGPELAVFPDTHGGLSTPNTAEGVKYYLDQAHRSQSVGAFSAAIAMYRAALDYLLFDQGFEKGTCGTKFNDLEAKKGEGSAPKWADEINPDLLKILKELGDGAIHPNDGNVENQKILDNGLIAKAMAAFRMLLELVYERPEKDRMLLGGLRGAAKTLKGGDAKSG